MNFSELSWKELKELSKKGKIGPMVGIESVMLITGKKPIWFCTETEGKNFVKEFDNYVCNVIPRLRKRDDHSLKYAVYRKYDKDEEQAFIKLCQAWELYEGDINHINCKIENLFHHIELGKALGYSDADIAKYIVHNFNKEKFKEWKENERHLANCV